MEAQILYIDTLFALNFAMDFLALFLCATILHLPKRILRLCLSSALGGAFAVLTVLFRIHIVVEGLLLLCMAAVLCLIAYRQLGSLRRTVGSILLFYLISILLGGCINMLYEWMYAAFGQTAVEVLRAADIILILGLLSSGALYAVSRFYGNRAERRSVTVSIFFQEKSVTLPMLVDSGCLLSDPISGKAALIVRLESISAILPSEIVACARAQGVRMPSTPTIARKCRLLPTKSLGREQLLLSIRPDKLRVTAEEKNKSYECEALVALIEIGRGYFGGYQGLLPSSLLFH